MLENKLFNDLHLLLDDDNLWIHLLQQNHKNQQRLALALRLGTGAECWVELMQVDNT